MANQCLAPRSKIQAGTIADCGSHTAGRAEKLIGPRSRSRRLHHAAAGYVHFILLNKTSITLSSSLVSWAMCRMIPSASMMKIMGKIGMPHFVAIGPRPLLPSKMDGQVIFSRIAACSAAAALASPLTPITANGLPSNRLTRSFTLAAAAVEGGHQPAQNTSTTTFPRWAASVRKLFRKSSPSRAVAGLPTTNSLSPEMRPSAMSRTV